MTKNPNIWIYHGLSFETIYQRYLTDLSHFGTIIEQSPTKQHNYWIRQSDFFWYNTFGMTKLILRRINELSTMKKFSILLVILFVFGLAANAQGNKEMDMSKLSKKERKALRKQQEEESIKMYIAILESKEWVIEAHTLYDRYQNSYILNPTINFVGMAKDHGAIQLGFDGLVGWNGVGGVTIDGSIDGYTIQERKGEKTPAARMTFRGRGTGSATVSLSVNSSGQARVDVSGNFGDRFSFAGRFVPMSQSVVYKGQSLY